MTSFSPIRGFGAAAALALAVWGAAAPARATTLADAIAYAYETNPGLQSQRAALRALDEGYVQARAGYGLQITGQFGATNYNLRNPVITASPAGPGPGEVTTKTDSETVTLSQPLYTGGRVKARVTEAEAQIKTGRENLRRFELDLLTRVVNAYVSVRRDLQLLQINQDTVAVLERELHDAEAKFKVRQLTATDTAQSKARLAQARSGLVAIQAQLAVSRAQYLAAVGLNPVDLEAPPPLETLPETIDKAFDAAEATNPTLRAAVFGELLSRARVAEAKAGKMPTVSAQVAFSRNPFIIYDPRYGVADTRVGSVTLTQPIFSSGALTSAIRQATEENNRDRLNIDDVRLQVTQNVSAAWEQLAASRKQVATYEDEMKADEFAFYGVRQEEKFALRSQIEVLNAELELTNAQQNLVRVRAQEYAGRVQLLSAVGTLEARMFAPRTQLYDTAANLRKVANKGATPLEIPVRVLDNVLGPKMTAQRPASIAEARPGGAVLPATPDLDAPITSILATLNRTPAPPAAAATPPDPRTPPTAATPVAKPGA